MSCGKLQRDALFLHNPHFAFHNANRSGSAIRQEHYKLILNHDDDSAGLFDLASDIAERENLAESKPEVSRKLKERLVSWMEVTKAGLPEKR